MMLSARALLSVIAAVLSSAALAQDVMRESQVDENRLIEALRPADAGQDPALPPGMRTRSIKVMSAGGGSAPRPQGPASTKPSSAALLITFETNSAELTATARQSLDVVARALNNEQLSGLTFAIEGHADVRGNADDNLRLSQARADSVRQYLVAVRNVDPARLRAVGKGDREPMNRQEAAAPENRRVTFVTQQ